MSLIYRQDERVTRWVSAQLGYDDPPPAYSSIGWERDGELTAGVFFDNWSRTNLFAHIAATQPMTQGFLAAVAAYAFDQLGCARMTFMVHDDNLRCLRFVESMGAIPEAKLSAGHENCDTVIYVLWRGTGFHAQLLQHRREEVTA